MVRVDQTHLLAQPLQKRCLILPLRNRHCFATRSPRAHAHGGSTAHFGGGSFQRQSSSDVVGGVRTTAVVEVL